MKNSTWTTEFNSHNLLKVASSLFFFIFIDFFNRQSIFEIYFQWRLGFITLSRQNTKIKKQYHNRELILLGRGTELEIILMQQRGEIIPLQLSWHSWAYSMCSWPCFSLNGKFSETTSLYVFSPIYFGTQRSLLSWNSFL